ncbi:MAG: ERF family protein [Myxococcales bacterium]|nr:ERF family protein [Myxococcales bacterium]
MTDTAVIRRQPSDVALEPAPSIDSLIALAVDKGADIDKLSKLLELKLQWEANEARKAYARAMAAFKANPPAIIKDKKVSFGTTSYWHATLGAVADAVIASLASVGISHAWTVDQPKGSIAVTCTLTHVDGHSESVTLIAPPDTSGNKNTIQQIASTVTYLQRYTLLAACGLSVFEHDDDGRSATPPPRPAKPAAQREPEPPDREPLLATNAQRDEMREIADHPGCPETASNWLRWAADNAADLTYEKAQARIDQARGMLQEPPPDDTPPSGSDDDIPFGDTPEDMPTPRATSGSASSTSGERRGKALAREAADAVDAADRAAADPPPERAEAAGAIDYDPETGEVRDDEATDRQVRRLQTMEYHCLRRMPAAWDVQTLNRWREDLSKAITAAGQQDDDGKRRLKKGWAGQLIGDYKAATMVESADLDALWEGASDTNRNDKRLPPQFALSGQAWSKRLAELEARHGGGAKAPKRGRKAKAEQCAAGPTDGPCDHSAGAYEGRCVYCNEPAECCHPGAPMPDGTCATCMRCRHEASARRKDGTCGFCGEKVP